MSALIKPPLPDATTSASKGQVVRLAIEDIDMANTIDLPEPPPKKYQSILPLAGKYADAPFMENLPEFLEQYNREINELNEE